MTLKSDKSGVQALKSATTRNVGEYRLLHVSDPYYGRSSEQMLAQICSLIAELRPTSILDFGCGKSSLVDAVAEQLNAKPYHYDPAIDEYSQLPLSRADVVINTDVLEHLDEHEVDTVLNDIRSISDKVFFNISTRPAKKTLASGENAHATVKSRNWWRDTIRTKFPVCIEVESKLDEARFITWQPGILVRITLRASQLFRFTKAQLRQKIGFSKL